jgi:ribosomal protein L39E
VYNQGLARLAIDPSRIDIPSWGFITIRTVKNETKHAARRNWIISTIDIELYSSPDQIRFKKTEQK